MKNRKKLKRYKLFRPLMGEIKKINIIIFPSPPPMIFNENKINDKIVVKKTKVNLIIIKR